MPEFDFDINKFNRIIRKNAHFFVYLVLGVLVLNAMRRTGVSRFKGITLTLLICILYAISYEIHQAYVPGRGPQVKDVLIDSCCSILGICIHYMVSRIKSRLTKMFWVINYVVCYCIKIRKMISEKVLIFIIYMKLENIKY